MRVQSRTAVLSKAHSMAPTGVTAGTRSRIRHLALVFSLIGVALPAAAAFQKIDEGIYRINLSSIDDLLELKPESSVRILVLEDKSAKLLSDAHLSLTRKWLQAGGVLWVAGDGFDSPIAKRVASFNVSDFTYKKATTGKQSGELVVRNASPRLVIADHPLTEGVEQLYLFVRHQFDGTLNSISLVEMTDTKGNHGIVIAAVPVGKGFLILDGTARKNRLPMLGRLKGFNPEHPNSLKQNDTWNGYDWSRFQQNVRDHAEAALASPEEVAGATN